MINPELGKTGSGTLANITFSVIAAGKCVLRIGGYVTDEPKLIDGNGDVISPCNYKIVDAYFEGIPPPPPPMPPPPPKAGWETAAFNFMGIYGYLMFPEECHPNDTITHQLTLATEPEGIHVNLLSVNVSCNTSYGKTVLYTEEIAKYKDLPEDWRFNKSITLTVPNDSYGKIYCVIAASTYRRFTTSNGAIKIYTTQIRNITYEELLTAYNDVLNQLNQTRKELNYWIVEYQKLNTTYGELSNQYNKTLKELNQWISDYQKLNRTYIQLLQNYNSLKSNYQKLPVPVYSCPC